MKNDDGIAKLIKNTFSQKSYIVTFRFEGPTMEKRFRNVAWHPQSQRAPARRGREQAEHDMREFMREEVLLPAARWAYRASQQEYVGSQDVNPAYWRRVMRTCRHAAYKCWVYFDAGHITVQMEVLCKAIGTVHDQNTLMCGIESLLNFEIGLSTRNIEHSMQDQYEMMRMQIYKEMLRGIEDDFLHDTIHIAERDKTTILGNRGEME